MAALAVITVVVVCCVQDSQADSGVPTITVHAMRYEFDPAEIVVQKGQTVRLIFIADDVPHGIAIDDLGVQVELPKRKPQTVMITPAVAGDFEGVCSKYCGTGHSDMTFMVHVKQSTR
jgi:cytochrome c oxidase subunit 2